MIDRRITAREVWPAGWKRLLGKGPLTIGIDPATTTKKKSNPTAISVIEKVGGIFIARAIVRFKTDNPDVTRAVLREALDLPEGCKVRKICILATSERFFAADLDKYFPGRPIESVIESAGIEYRGEKMLVKTYLGNLVVNALHDAQLWMPSATWLRDDIRQMKREKGGFDCDPDEVGNHADCFCCVGAGLHGHITGGGPAEAEACGLGSAAGASRNDDFNRPHHDDDGPLKENIYV